MPRPSAIQYTPVDIKPNKNRWWSAEQAACFATIEETDRNILISALAGCGKTTTLVEMAKRWYAANRGGRIIAITFTKKMVKELETKTSGLARARSFHQYGYALCKENLPEMANAKRWMLNNYIRAQFRDVAKLSGAIKRIVIERCMSAGVHPNNFGAIKSATMAEFAGQDDVPWKSRLRAAEVAQRVLTECIKPEWCNDPDYGTEFAHCAYLPWYYKWTPRRPFDLGLVDEFQDTNTPQYYLASICASRIIAVGDRNQAIYRWRGAHAGVMNTAKRELDMAECHLTGSFRCSVAVAARAKQYVPAFRSLRDGSVDAIPSEQGLVTQATAMECIAQIKTGQAIISRLNAPLVGLWVGLMRKGLPASILGKDLAGKLRKLLKATQQSRLGAAVDIAVKALTHEINQKASIGMKAKAEKDLVNTLCALVDGFGKDISVGAFLDKLDTHTLDDKAGDVDMSQVVILSTVHQAKGLEWPKVWMLHGTFRDSFDPDELDPEENNLAYVAITRAQNELVYTYIDGATAGRFVAAQEAIEARKGTKSKIVRVGEWSDDEPAWNDEED